MSRENEASVRLSQLSELPASELARLSDPELKKLDEETLPAAIAKAEAVYLEAGRKVNELSSLTGGPAPDHQDVEVNAFLDGTDLPTVTGREAALKELPVILGRRRTADGARAKLKRGRERIQHERRQRESRAKLPLYRAAVREFLQKLIDACNYYSNEGPGAIEKQMSQSGLGGVALPIIPNPLGGVKEPYSRLRALISRAAQDGVVDPDGDIARQVLEGTETWIDSARRLWAHNN